MNNRSLTPLPPADFTPEMGNYKSLQPFRYWCQKVLPLVYDDSLSYYELLCKVVDYLNKTMEDVETLHGDVNNLHTAYEELQNYVNTYFSSLDVQQEINNKLDNMATSGELTTIITPFLENALSPVFVDSTEEMKDKTKLYVLKSTGILWSFKDGSFQSTGIQISPLNSDFISVYSTRINQQNYSTLLPDLNNANDNYAYLIQYGVPGELPNNYPITSGMPNDLLITYATGNNKSQILIRNGSIYSRFSNDNGEWTEWATVDYNEVLTTNKAIRTFVTRINQQNYSTLLPDLNNANDNYAYLIQYGVPGELPNNYPITSGMPNDLLITYATGNNKSQILIRNGSIYSRFSNDNGEWTEWATVDYNEVLTTNKAIRTFVTRINQQNYSTLLPDLNNAKDNYAYLIQYGIVGGLPNNYPISGQPNDLLVTYATGNNKSQLLIRDGVIYSRFSNDNGVWGDWKEKISYIKVTNSNFIEAMNKAYNIGNIDVYFTSTLYDLYSIYGGDDFFNNYNHENDGYGPVFGNNCKYHLNHSRFVFNNKNTNPEIETNFSPINVYDNCEIYGGYIEAKRCRYAIHADAPFFSKTNSSHVIDSMVINFDNSENISRPSNNAIGGGLSLNGTVKINNVMMVSDKESSINYHANGTGAGISKIFISNCYVPKGNIQVNDPYLVSGNISYYIITNNYAKINTENNNNIKGISYNNVTPS